MKKKNRINIKITRNENVIITDSKGNKIKMSIIDLCGIAREYDAFCYREDLRDMIDKAVVRGDIPMKLVGNRRFMNMLLSAYMDAKEDENLDNSNRCLQAALAACLPSELDEPTKTILDPKVLKLTNQMLAPSSIPKDKPDDAPLPRTIVVFRQGGVSS